VSDADARPPRGSFVLYVVAFVLMVAAGVALVASAKGLLESTRLLWVSAGLSVGAILVAVVGLFVPRRR
jgi:predicted histidine transporter YuiF (NhaC family)